MGLHRILTSIAPGHPQQFLRILCRRLERRANRQVRKGKIGRVVPTADLVAGGMGWLDGVAGESFRDAVRFRDGLMMAMLVSSGSRETW